MITTATAAATAIPIRITTTIYPIDRKPGILSKVALAYALALCSPNLFACFILRQFILIWPFRLCLPNRLFAKNAALIFF